MFFKISENIMRIIKNEYLPGLSTRYIIENPLLKRLTIKVLSFSRVTSFSKI